MGKTLIHIGKAAAYVALALTVAGCTAQDKRLSFDGQFFRAKSQRVTKDDYLNFIVTVQQAAKSLEGARQAGVHEATYYCLANYGTSRIKWVQGPDVPDAALSFDKDALVLRGECNP